MYVIIGHFGNNTAERFVYGQPHSHCPFPSKVRAETEIKKLKKISPLMNFEVEAFLGRDPSYVPNPPAESA